ncbi:MAG: ABC transporter permease [Chloroflexi bacterium]|nr:ABC transporter permease [Chloroflexota bacterium]
MKKTSQLAALLEPSLNVIMPLLSILAAFLLSGLLILAWGSSPLQAYAALFSGAFGSLNALATTLTRLTPLVFTGLAVAYGYRSGFFNVGAEGQLFIGGLAAGWAAITFSGLPAALLIPLSMLAAAAAGAFLALLPGILKAWRGFNEVLTSLLLNYIAIQYFEWTLRVDHPTPGVDQAWTLINWLGIKDASQPFPKSAEIPLAAQLPSLGGWLNSPFMIRLFGQSPVYLEWAASPALDRITLGVVLALLAIGLMYLIIFKTTTGFHARAVGVNPQAAAYMGIDVRKTILTTALISGSLAGLAGGVEVLGSSHRLIDRFLVDAGFTGIPVALIGQLHPFGVGLGALFFGALRAGANKMQIITAVPTAVVSVIQAAAILFAIAGAAFDVSTRVKSKQIAPQTLSTPASEEPHA